MSWLRRIFEPKQPRAKRHPLAGMAFRSNEAFFEYQCHFGDTKLRQGHPCYAIVIDDYTEIAQKAHSEPIKDPLERVFRISIASKDHDFFKFVAHNQRKGLIQPGDIVAWVPLKKLSAGDRNWDGQLLALCAPEFDEHGIKVITYF